jgi:hypothetical protein
MNPCNFPQANKLFGPPPGLDESQVMTVPACLGTISEGNMDGATCIVVCWMPSQEDLDRLNSGIPIYLTFLGGLPAHGIATEFNPAIRPI